MEHVILVAAVTLAIVEAITLIWAIGTIMRCQRQVNDMRRWHGRAAPAQAKKP